MILNSPTISGSLTVTGNILTSGSITLSGSVASASFAATSSFVALAQSASNAVAAQTASFANAFTVAGNLTAQTLVVQTITSSVDFVTGSTRFGSLLANTHVFSGSVTMNPNGLFVSSSGLVGIGTTSPAYVLDVNGTGKFTRTIIGGTATSRILQVNTSGNDGIRIQTSGDNPTLDLMQTAAANAGARNWRIVTNWEGWGTMDFQSGTNNTQDPATTRLSISGTTGAATFSNTVTATEFILNNGSADGGQLVLASSGYSNWNVDNYSGRLRAYYGSTEHFGITSAGNVGIGTTNPTTQFQVRRNFWQFWVEKSHNANANLFSVTIPDFGAATVTIAGSRYSPGADNYQGTSTFYIFITNTGAVSVNGGSNFGSFTPSTTISSKTVIFSSAYAGNSTNYSNVSVTVVGSGHNNGNESALTVTVL